MKKVLGVSVIAMLAIAPMVASAATPVTLVNGGNTPTPSKTVASTTYVQGAYNTLGKQVNNIISESTVPAGTYVAVGEDKNVSQNLVALDSAIRDLNGGGEGSVADQIKAGAQNADYSANGTYSDGTIGKAIQTNTSAIGDNATAIQSNADEITTLKGDASTPGSVASAILVETNRATGAESDLSDRIGALNADGHYISKDLSVSSNLSLLDTQVYDNEQHIGTMAALESSHHLAPLENRSTLVAAIKTLDSVIYSLGGGNGSVADQIRADAQNANYNPAGTYVAGTIGGTIQSMQAQTVRVSTKWDHDDVGENVNLFPG